MRYYFEPKIMRPPKHGVIYICDHPVYSRCTLYKFHDRGLAIIQQRYNPRSKHTYWTEIDEYLVEELYFSPKFTLFFEEYSEPPADDLYPTFTLRQAMWALRLKPLERMEWETSFDHKPV